MAGSGRTCGASAAVAVAPASSASGSGESAKSFAAAVDTGRPGAAAFFASSAAMLVKCVFTDTGGASAWSADATEPAPSWEGRGLVLSSSFIDVGRPMNDFVRIFCDSISLRFFSFFCSFFRALLARRSSLARSCLKSSARSHSWKK